MEEDVKIFNEMKVNDFTVYGDANEYLENILGERFKEYRRKWNKVERLEKALTEDPSNSAFQERLSELYGALGRKREAMEAAQKAVTEEIEKVKNLKITNWQRRLIIRKTRGSKSKITS